MGEVVELPVITRLDIPPERTLNAALKKGLAEVVVIGFDQDGDFYFASSKSDGGGVIWLLEMAKKKLLEVDI
jgi:hypothetical protein